MAGMDPNAQIEGLKTQMAIMQKQLDGVNKTKAELAQYKGLFQASQEESFNKQQNIVQLQSEVEELKQEISELNNLNGQEGQRIDQYLNKIEEMKGLTQ